MILDEILYMIIIITVMNGAFALLASPLGDKMIDWLLERDFKRK